MVRALTEIIAAIPWWVRLGLAVVCLVLGGLVFWYLNVRGGILLLGIGFVFLMFSGRSDSERHGYHF